jgi:hypothetical protein
MPTIVREAFAYTLFEHQWTGSVCPMRTPLQKFALGDRWTAAVEENVRLALAEENRGSADPHFRQYQCDGPHWPAVSPLILAEPR